MDRLFSLAVFGGMRVWLSLWGMCVVWFALPQTRLMPAELLLNLWNRWDTEWYLLIASRGYADDGSTAFFPLYPLLTRIVGHLLGGEYLLGGLIVSNSAALGGIIMLYRLVFRKFGSDVARKSLIWFITFPSSFFLFMAYTESLFLLLVLLFFEQLDNGRWLQAGFWGMLASMTRVHGILLIFSFIVTCILNWRAEKKLYWQQLVGALLLGCGLGAYSAYLYWTFGNPLFFVHSAQQWRITLWPWESILLSIRVMPTSQFMIQNILDLAITVGFLVLAGIGSFRLPLAWSGYMWAILLLSLSTTFKWQNGLPLAAMLRYILVAFPGFVTLGLLASCRWMRVLVPLLFGLQMIFIALFILKFWVA